MAKSKFTQSQIKEMGEMYSLGISSCKIALKFQCLPSLIRYYIKIHCGLKIRPPVIISMENKNLIKEYYEVEKMPASKISKKTQIPKEKIYKILHQMKVKIRDNSESQKRIFLTQKDFFKVINTEEKAYFLGLMYADGWVREKQGLVGLSLQDQDVYLVSKLSNCLFSYDRVKQYKCKSNKNMLLFSCREMAQDLIKNGCMYRKTYHLKFPTSDQVPENLMNHFIRGMFDGDGCITFKEYNLNNLNHIKSSITCVATLSFCQGLQNFLKQKEIIGGLTQHQGCKVDNIYYYYCCNFKGVKNFYNYIYQNSTIWMTRKRDKFEKMFQEKQQLKIKKDNKLLNYYHGHGIRLLNNRWRATIIFKNRSINVGCFASKDEATLAYNKKVDEINNLKYIE